MFMFQKRCSYRHYTKNSADEEITRLITICNTLNLEIIALQTENDTKINNLVKVHVTELEELRKENIEFKNELQACQ